MTLSKGTLVKNGVEYGGGGGGTGSNVSYIGEFTEGTKIGTISIDGEDKDIITPKIEEVIELTMAEYEALPASKYTDNKQYLITDYTESALEYSGDSMVGVVGEVIAYMGTVAPDNFLICDGTEYNITKYNLLAEHIKNNFGSYNYFGGDGETTFAVPDLRGEFLRGSGENGHENCGNGANVGVHQKATSSPIIVGTGSANNYMLQSMQRVNNWSSYAYPDKVYYDDTTQWINFNYSGKGTDSQKEYAYASRPTNTSVLYCIRYKQANACTSGEVTLDTAGSSNNSIRFGIDENGNYGYYKVGADTLTPFKSGDTIDEGTLLYKEVKLSTSDSTSQSIYEYTADEDCCFVYCIFITNGAGCYADVTFNGMKTRITQDYIACIPRIVRMSVGDNIIVEAFGSKGSTSNSSASVIAYKYKPFDFSKVTLGYGGYPASWRSTSSSGNKFKYDYTINIENGYLLFGLCSAVGEGSIHYIKVNNKPIRVSNYGTDADAGLYPVKKGDIVSVLTYGYYSNSTVMSTLYLVTNE